MKIYVIHEYMFEDDEFYNMGGIFTELELAKSVQQASYIEMVIIREMVLLDNQFVCTGFSHMKEIQINEYYNDIRTWSDWVETFILQ